MKDAKNLINQYRNYFIIGILAAIAVFFLPMLGTSVGLAFVVPNTVAGWIVYVSTKLCIVVINLLIYDQFMKRAKINVRDDPKFVEAERILNEELDGIDDALPADYYIRRMYRSKMTSTAIFTLLGVFGFTNAILTFDWVSMLSYTFTIIMALTFGWISMGEAEVIWIEQHYKYAKRVERERAEAKKQADLEAKRQKDLAMVAAEPPKQGNDTANDIGGTSLLEPPYRDCPACPNN